MGLRVCIPRSSCRSGVFSSSLNGRWRSEGRRWPACPRSAERCVVLRATSGSSLDATMAKIGQDSSPLNARVKDNEKKPHGLHVCPSRAHTHTNTRRQNHRAMRFHAPAASAYDVVKAQAGTVPTPHLQAHRETIGV